MTAPPSKELGESEVASDLVPGNVEHMHGQVSGLRKEAKEIAVMEESFRAVRVPGWIGGSADDWEDDFDDECAKWKLYGALLTTAANTLNTYTHALSNAQAKAREAIALYKKGDQVTASALEEWQTARDAFLCNQASTRPQTIAEAVKVQPPRQGMTPTDPGPFDDPGEELRQQARELLKTARDDLDAAGDEALARLDSPSALRRNFGNFFRGGWSVSGPTLDWTIWEKEFRTYDRTPGRTGNSSPFKIELGRVEGSVSVYGTDGEFTEYYGDVKVTGDGRIVVVEAGGSAGARVGPDGLEVDADAHIELVTAEGTITGEYGVFQAEVRGHATVGADGNAHVTINKNGVSAGGEVFIGGSAGMNGKAGAGGVDVTGGAEARMGFGGGVETDAGVRDGKVKLEIEAGATLIFGAKVEFGMEIDFKEAGETIAEAADAVTFWD